MKQEKLDSIPNALPNADELALENEEVELSDDVLDDVAGGSVLTSIKNKAMNKVWN